MAEEDSPSSSLLPPISASATITGLSLLSLTHLPVHRRDRDILFAIPARNLSIMFGVAVGLGEASSTGLEGGVHQRR